MSALKELKFDYDAMGNRIAKHVLSATAVWESTTYYVRDAQGNVMSVYDYTEDELPSLIVKEQHIYGSSRLGMLTPKELEMIESEDPVDDGMFCYERGYKQYELSNHLGNVLSVISDQKIVRAVGEIIEFYIPEVISYSDYYPFGSAMAERSWQGDYRYGFNGKEKENDHTSGNYDFGARILDSRLGRFFNTDPLFKINSGGSSYSVSGSNPILNLDYNGLFKIESKVSKEMQIKYPHLELAITRFSNIANTLTYLLEVARTVPTSDGKEITQTLSDYMSRNTGLSENQIRKQLTEGFGPTLSIVDEGVAGWSARTSNGFLIEIDVRALQYLGDPNISAEEFANLAVAWGITLLHEMNHAGDIQTNGQLTGGMHNGVEQPEGKQIYRKAQEPWRHRGTDMENAFFGTDSAPQAYTITSPKTGVTIPAGSVPNASLQKKAIGMTDKEIIKRTGVNETTKRKVIMVPDM